jgi:hypothetical protein
MAPRSAEALVDSHWRLIPLLLVGLVTMATAQDDANRQNDRLPGEPPTCNVASASRTREACQAGPPNVLRTEREFTRSLEPVKLTTSQCDTKINLEYVQRDTIAHVNGVISNETCAASGGSYEIAALVKDENGESETLVFSESWHRDDDQPVEFTADYPIGENMELIRLSTRRLRCMCETEPASDQEP